jgi:hypothetical protein
MPKAVVIQGCLLLAQAWLVKLLYMRLCFHLLLLIGSCCQVCLRWLLQLQEHLLLELYLRLL